MAISKDFGIINVLEFGAKGDGVTDDTDALQSWLNTIAATKLPGYLPSASNFYKITRTLTLQQGIGIGIVGAGQRPASDSVAGSSTIRWAGAAGGTILRLTGVRQSRLEHFSLDGNGIAGIGLDFDAVNAPGNLVSTCDRIEGLSVFGCAVGVQIGTSHFQADQSEWCSCLFNHNTVGVSILDANAVWHTFRGCQWFANGTGITAVDAASNGGHFDIISGKFGGNTVVDVKVFPSRAFTMVSCHSELSNRFLERGLASSASSPGLLLGCSVNGVLDVNGVGISWHGSSPLSMIGCCFRAQQGAVPFKVKTTQSGDPTQVAAGTIVAIGTVFDGQPFTGNGMVLRAEIAAIGVVMGDTNWYTSPASRPHMGPDLVQLDNGAGYAVGTVPPIGNNIRRSTAALMYVGTGFVMAAGANNFYIKSDLADGNLACEVLDIISWGGTNGESTIIGVHVVDDHTTNPGHLKIVVRTSAAVTLNADLRFRIRVRSRTIQID